MNTVATLPGLFDKRRGPGHWMRSTLLMTKWEIHRMRGFLPVAVAVQVFTSIGTVLGVGLLFGDIGTRQAGYLATGATVITLITVGLVMGPQFIAQLKMTGAYEFHETLPIPRSSAAVAWLVLSATMAIPGMVAALVVAALYYDLPFDIDWGLFTLTVGLVLLTGTMIGYALAHAIPRPSVTNLVSQMMVFVIFGFSPIAFPAENLPSWLAEVHDWLPFIHMGNAIRGALIPLLAEDVGRSMAVMAAWAGGSIALTALTIRRRG